jgi:hypothetical protein
MNTIVVRCRTSAAVAAAFIFISLCPSTAWTDTPTQTQKAIQVVCNRAAASYDKRDLSGFTAIYATNFTDKSVLGPKSNRLQLVSGAALMFANANEKTTSSCTVSQVISRGNQAKAVLHWHHDTRSLRSVPAYTITRDFQAQTLWKKTAGGWQEVSADVTRSTTEYRR